jgi:hypothetical protein
MDLSHDFRLAADKVAFAQAAGIVPDAWQRQLLESSSLRTILNCSRQSGKSTLAGLLALHRALYYPKSLVLCLAPALRQSQELFQKIGESYATLGSPLLRYGERKLSLELTNSSRIVTLPGSEKTIRGFSGVSLLILDEASRIDDALYDAVVPMLAVSGGRLLMLSTPFGKRGVFYETWAHGEAWERYEVPATECPRISDDFLEAERRDRLPWQWRQEYMCSFEELEDSVFSADMIDAAVSADVEPLFG